MNQQTPDAIFEKTKNTHTAKPSDDRQYADIYIRNTPQLYTWSFTEKPNQNLNLDLRERARRNNDMTRQYDKGQPDRPVAVGSRVQVFFRGRPRIGIVIRIHQRPDFHTIQPIQKVLNTHFIPEREIQKALWVSKKYFCSLQKVLSLMIPEGFMNKHEPVAPAIKLILKDPEASVRGTKQKAVLEAISKKSITKEEAKKIASLATIKSLIEKGIIGEEIQAQPKPELPTEPKLFPLTEKQASALKKARTDKKIKLLWGVTGSGKTEIYKNLILDTIRAGEQALLIVPEIALTHHLLSRLRATFGSTMAVWHSDMSTGEKLRQWQSINKGNASVIVGTRSSLLLSYPNLTRVIVDEEHTWTLKNQSNPRFSTHEILEFIHENHNVDILLGSATPRLESWHKAHIGHYTRIDLPDRVHQTPMPAISIMDMRQEAKKENFSLFSHALLRNIDQALKKKEQVVLFLNKRGLYGNTFCKTCGHTFECPNCSQNMKLHAQGSKKAYICHFCGRLEGFTGKCPTCASTAFQFKSSGTQQAERELQGFFPQARIARADADTITKRSDMPELLKKLEAGAYDILLGTQMIAKGLDLDRVQLVGILLADTGLSLPDFRSEERVFQLIMQVSGRAGRREKQGKIIIQTYQPENKIYPFTQSHDIAGFMEYESKNRSAAHFPPFGGVIKCTFTHPDKSLAYEKAKRWKKYCQAQTSFSVHMAPAFFPKIHNKYSFHVFIQNQDQNEIETWLQSQKDVIPPDMRIDVSPISLL